MNLTPDQIAHGLKLLNRLIQSNEDVMGILASLDNKEAKRTEFLKDDTVYQYLTNHLKTLESHE